MARSAFDLQKGRWLRGRVGYRGPIEPSCVTSGSVGLPGVCWMALDFWGSLVGACRGFSDNPLDGLAAAGRSQGSSGGFGASL